MRHFRRVLISVLLIATGIGIGANPASAAPSQAAYTTPQQQLCQRLSVGGKANRIEIHISVQRLCEYHNGALTNVLTISSGSEQIYRGSRGMRARAHTPRGDFQIFRKIASPTYRSRLGSMPWPSYFIGGFAIHGGDVSIPRASHGCIRIPRDQAKAFFYRNPVGTQVRVLSK